MIYTCYENSKAKHIAEELGNKRNGNIQIRDTCELSRNDMLQNTDPDPQCEVMLLYLKRICSRIQVEK